MLALGLSGCSLIAQAPARDETGQITESNNSTDVFDLVVGDCTNDEVDLPDGEFPGDEYIATESDTICYDAFTDFVGVSYEESRLDYFPMTPTEGSWGGGDREVMCFVFDANAEKLTGTAAGLGE
jgi:hypothetical protein